MEWIEGLGFIFVIASWLYLTIKNANRAEDLGKSPAVWGGLSFLLFPIGTILITWIISTEYKRMKDRQENAFQDKFGQEKDRT